MTETNKTGLELLEELLLYVARLEKKIDIIDQNVKALLNDTKPIPAPPKSANHITAIEKPVAPKPTDKGFKNFNFQPTDAAKMKHEEPLAAKRADKPFIPVVGKMVSNIDGKIVALSGIDVTIFDETDAVVKKTRTNKIGEWVSHLEPNRNYVALFEGEFNGKRLVPINRNFTTPISLQPGQSEFRVI
jgi:hypothetical protein